jgi:hypothetical protein
MKDLILKSLPKHTISNHSDPNLYIVDYKDTDKKNGIPPDKRRGVLISNTYPKDIKSVSVLNENTIEICFDGFDENALPVKKGLHCSQCECILFPGKYIPESWLLFIETKYADDKVLAFDPKHDYPNKMIEQIKATVEYFRNKGILSQEQRVNAIISFPNLLEGYSADLFMRSKESIEDILINYHIKVRATNSAKVISDKRIKI